MASEVGQVLGAVKVIERDRSEVAVVEVTDSNDLLHGLVGHSDQIQMVSYVCWSTLQSVCHPRWFHHLHCPTHGAARFLYVLAFAAMPELQKKANLLQVV
mgnify:CR=1 FL=1